MDHKQKLMEMALKNTKDLYDKCRGFFMEGPRVKCEEFVKYFIQLRKDLKDTY